MRRAQSRGALGARELSEGRRDPQSFLSHTASPGSYRCPQRGWCGLEKHPGHSLGALATPWPLPGRGALREAHPAQPRCATGASRTGSLPSPAPEAPRAGPGAVSAQLEVPRPSALWGFPTASGVLLLVSFLWRSQNGNALIQSQAGSENRAKSPNLEVRPGAGPEATRSAPLRHLRDGTPSHPAQMADVRGDGRRSVKERRGAACRAQAASSASLPGRRRHQPEAPARSPQQRDLASPRLHFPQRSTGTARLGPPLLLPTTQVLIYPRHHHCSQAEEKGGL